MDFSWSIAFGTHGERRQCDKSGRTKACQDLLASRLAIRHSRYMGNDVLTASLANPADFGRSLSKRQLRYFRVQVEDWYDVCRHLSDWEDRHLVDAPAPEHLAEHGRLLDELEQVGRWLALATQSPDFPRPQHGRARGHDPPGPQGCARPLARQHDQGTPPGNP